MADTKRNILFVCSKNQWRSPTAETLYRKQPGLSVRSAGTSSSARHHVNADDVEWAVIFFVMEDKNLSFNLDLTHCPHCGGQLRIVAAILQRQAIEKILNHRG
jgi:predicted protein tyrosine phosphatase